jgi:hypothetical protein
MLILVATLNLMIVIVVVKIDVVLCGLSETISSLPFVVHVALVSFRIFVLVKNYNSLLFCLN